jgi:N-acetylglucosamine-6-phosphate deacetylase
MDMKVSAKYSFINGIFTKDDKNTEFDFLIPGFIDIHCHGGGGKYFSEDAKVAAEAHRKAGTRIQIASLVTQEIPKLAEQINYLSDKDIFGIHLEGPYLSHKYCGAHDSQLLRTPNLDEIKMLLDAGKGLIKMITIAPELPGAIEVIKFLTNKGIVVAIGHSDAKAKDTFDAISAGATLVTHFNNAMAKLGATDSLSEVALKSDLFLELIQDGSHVSAADSFSIVTKATNRIVAITDAMSAAAGADGEYLIGGRSVTVRNRVAKLSGTNTLAGSTLTMLDAFLNIYRVFGFEQAVKYTSLNPAKILSINPYDGYIAIKGKEVIHL